MTDQKLLNLYLEQACNHDFLSSEAEKELIAALDIAWPDRLSATKHDPPPPEARPIIDEIMSHFYRMVVDAAKKSASSSVDIMDIIQDANTYGLRLGVVKFDPAKGCRLSTYISYWIYQAIGRILDQQRAIIRKPVHAWRYLKNVQAAEAMLGQLNIAITDKALAQHMGDKWTADKVREVKKLFAQSETEPMGHSLFEDSEDDKKLSLEDPGLTPEGTVMEKAKKTALIDLMLKKLNYRQFQILAYRYGLDGREPLTLKKIGLKFDLTRERIRQLEKDAITELNGAAIELADFRYD